MYCLIKIFYLFVLTNLTFNLCLKIFILLLNGFSFLRDFRVIHNPNISTNYDIYI